MTRNGKIARCPRHIRNQLNRRLQDGEQGETLLKWLNSVAEVKEMLADQFAGVLISKQNLSEWRQGGFEEWLEHEKSCEFIRNLADQGGDFDEASVGMEVSDWLAARLAVDLAQVALKLIAEAPDAKERWTRLRELLPHLAELRRHDHRAVRLRRDQEVWEREDEQGEKAGMEKEIKEAKQKALAPLFARLSRGPLAEGFGGGKQGEWIADFIIAVKHDLPLPSIEDLKKAVALEPNPVKTVAAQPGRVIIVPAESSPDMPGQTQSNSVRPGQTGII